MSLFQKISLVVFIIGLLICPIGFLPMAGNGDGFGPGIMFLVIGIPIALAGAIMFLLGYL